MLGDSVVGDAGRDFGEDDLSCSVFLSEFFILMVFPSKVVSLFRRSVSCGEVVVSMMLPIRVVVKVVLSWGRARSMASTCEYSSVQSSVCSIRKLVWVAVAPGAVLSIPCLMSSRRLWRAALVRLAVVLAVAMTARR